MTQTRLTETDKPQRLPQLVLAYYGDDFTGSTDALEALATAGLRTVLFLEPPTEDTLARYPGVRAVGLAGVSRSLRRQQMELVLSDALAALGRLGAPLVHYKVCSTFDSSREVGSIGFAMELGRSALGVGLVPIVVGVPTLGRYCVFGNLFARAGLEGPVYRLDRHPTMSRHPTTPMDESDIRVLLSRETDLRVALIDVAQLSQPVDRVIDDLARLHEEGADAVLFDTTDECHLATVGQMLWNLAVESHPRPTFVVGSSGVDYALRAYWQQANLLVPPSTPTHVSACGPLVCLSGSCSPVTDRQITNAVDHGFEEIALDPVQLVQGDDADRVVDEIARQALPVLAAGRSVILHTSRGPEDPRIASFKMMQAQSPSGSGAAELIGPQLGKILRRLLGQSAVKRIVVAGGDSSGYIARELGIESLEFAATIAPGVPLCRAASYPKDTLADGIEIAFKGGQVGQVDFLLRVLGR